MSISAIIVMVLSAGVTWGVAGWALVVTLRRANDKASLLASQGGFEPFSPRAFRDLQQAVQDTSVPTERLAELRAARHHQLDALSRYEARFYAWSDSDLPK